MLPHHAFVKLVLHVHETRGFRFADAGHRNPGPSAYDERNVLDGDLRAKATPLLLPRSFLVEDLLLQRPLLVAQLGRALEVLVADRALLAVGHVRQLRLEIIDLRGRHLAGNARAGAGLVDHVDGLVGKEPIRDVAVGQPRGVRKRVVRYGDLVMVLVVPPEARENRDRLLHRGRIDDHGLEAPFERTVLFHVSAVFVQRRGSDALQFTPRQRRLEHVRRVDRTLGRTGSNQRVQLIDEQDDVAVAGDLVHDRLEALFELAPVLGPGDHGGHVQCKDAVFPEALGHLPAGDQLCQSFDDRRLPDSGLADQDRVVLFSPAEDLGDALDLGLAPDGRIQLPLACKSRQVAAEVIQRRRLGLLFAASRRCRGGRGRRRAPRGASPARRPHVRAQDLERLGARFVYGHAQGIEDLGGDSLALAQQPQEQVLGADVGVVEFTRLRHRELEHLLRGRRVRKLAQRDRRLALAHRFLDAFVDPVEIHVEVAENVSGHAFALANQSKEDVFRSHIVDLETNRLLTSH